MRIFIKLTKWTAVFTLLILICGCWDIKEIQDINYITAIGIDYENENFVLHTQMMDFASVAKAETGKSEKPAQVWTGKTKGKTLDMAMNNLYTTTQERTSWSHISCIIISETVMKSGLLSKLDTVGRYQEIRLTPWVFGTHESIEELMNVPAFFNLSPLNTLMYEPMEEYKQMSLITPLRYFDFIGQLTEPAFTVMLPSLSIDVSTWKINNKENSKLKMDGAFAMSEGKLSGYLATDRLSGLRWLEENTKRSSLPINKDNEQAAVIILQNPKIRKEMKMVNGEPRYKIHIKLNGNVVEVRTDLTKSEIEREAAKFVKQEVFSSFRNGLEIKADLYSLEHLLFKKATSHWKKLKHSSEFLIDENSLEEVTVDVNLEHTGMKQLPRKE